MGKRFLKLTKKLIEGKMDLLVRIKESELACMYCLPSAPLNGHPELNGVLFHSRIDCPPDTVYMLNEDELKLKRD